MSKPIQIGTKKGIDGSHWFTNGKMARMLGIDPKTLRKWARRGFVPSYINRVNGYRYYVKAEVITALKAVSGSKKSVGKSGKADRL